MAPISVLPALPASGAPGATIPPSEAANATTGDAADAPSFLNQFKAALATLGLGRSQRAAVPGPSASIAAALDPGPATDAPTEPDDGSATDTCDRDGCGDTPGDDLPEMLATLGFVLVPVASLQPSAGSAASDQMDASGQDSAQFSMTIAAADRVLDARAVSSQPGDALASAVSQAFVDVESPIDADPGAPSVAASALTPGSAAVPASSQAVASNPQPGDPQAQASSSQSGDQLDLLSAALAPDTAQAAPPSAAPAEGPPGGGPPAQRLSTDVPVARPRGGTPARQYDGSSVTGSVTASVVARHNVAASVTRSVTGSVTREVAALESVTGSVTAAAGVTPSVTGSVTGTADSATNVVPGAARPHATAGPQPSIGRADLDAVPGSPLAGAASRDTAPPNFSDGHAPTPAAPAASAIASATLGSTAVASPGTVAAVASPGTIAAARPADRVDAVNGRRAAGPTLAQAAPLLRPGDGAIADAGTPSDGDLGDDDASPRDHPASSPRPEAPGADRATMPEPSAAAPVPTPTPLTPAATARPSDIASQIAHQADLYRLPGGRGVRIQLHPEGLGGVEVTVRYGAAGALELHLNVDHAATGALVQAGWGELRDALALQGISPDRLVLSVSSRSDAGLSDTGQGGFRSDAGQPGFAGQAGQERHDRGERRPRSTWPTSRTDLTVALDDHEPLPTVAATSRIDYRV